MKNEINRLLYEFMKFMERPVFGEMELWHVVLSVTLGAMALFMLLCFLPERLCRALESENAEYTACHVLMDLMQLPESMDAIVDIFLNGEEDDRVKESLQECLRPYTACAAVCLIGTPEEVGDELRQLHMYHNKVLLTVFIFESEKEKCAFRDPLSEIMVKTFENRFDKIHAFATVDANLKKTMKLIMLLV